MVNLGELDRIGLPTGTLIHVDQLPQMEIIQFQDELNRTNHQVHVLQQKIEQINKILVDRIEQVEKIRFVEFKNNDVYEVNKRIERLGRKIALLESNSNSSAVSVNFILTLIAINNLFLGLAWWIYG
jgi:tetrahydromethanopterin S-methyltransferase subunit G